MTQTGDDFRIRRARPTEAQLLSELALRSKAHWGYAPEFMAAVRTELTYSSAQLGSTDLHFHVLEVDDSVAGFYALKWLQPPEIELDSLFLEPSLIGKGFGRSLIEHAKRIAAELGATRMIIQGDPYAEKFYLAAGAVLTGQRESGSIRGRWLPTFAIDLRDASHC